MSSRVVATYSIIVGGPAARFIITKGVNGGMNDITLANVPFGSRPIGIMASSGSMSSIMIGVMSAWASWIVLTTDPMPMRMAEYSRYPSRK